MQLWDFGGQERFRFLLSKYVDLTNPTSIENANEWMELVRKYNDNLPIILVGTKYDLAVPEIIDDITLNLVVNSMF